MFEFKDIVITPITIPQNDPLPESSLQSNASHLDKDKPDSCMNDKSMDLARSNSYARSISETTLTSPATISVRSNQLFDGILLKAKKNITTATNHGKISYISKLVIATGPFHEDSLDVIRSIENNLPILKIYVKLID